MRKLTNEEIGEVRGGSDAKWVLEPHAGARQFFYPEITAVDAGAERSGILETIATGAIAGAASAKGPLPAVVGGAFLGALSAGTARTATIGLRSTRLRPVVTISEVP